MTTSLVSAISAAAQEPEGPVTLATHGPQAVPSKVDVPEFGPVPASQGR